MKRRKAVLIALIAVLILGGCSRGKEDSRGDSLPESGTESGEDADAAADTGSAGNADGTGSEGAGTTGDANGTGSEGAGTTGDANGKDGESANTGDDASVPSQENLGDTKDVAGAGAGADTAGTEGTGGGLTADWENLPEVDIPEETDAVTLGMEYLEEGEYARAQACFWTAVEDKKDLELAYRGIGIAKMGEGDCESAVEAFNLALGEAGADAQALEYDICYYKASAMVKLGELNGALEVYNSLVDYKPEGKTYVGRGGVYAAMGNMDMAREDFDTAISKDSKNYELYIEIFQILDSAGRNDIGQEYLKKALEIDKDKNKNGLEKGMVYYYLEQYDKARTELEKIKGDGDARVTLYLAKTYEALGDASYAQSLYREYLEKDSADGNIYNMIAVSEMNEGNYESALETLQEGIEKAQYGRQNLYRNEVVAYEYLLDFAAAKAKLEEYMKNYPQDAEAAREYIFLKSRSN